MATEGPAFDDISASLYEEILKRRPAFNARRFRAGAAYFPKDRVLAVACVLKQHPVMRSDEELALVDEFARNVKFFAQLDQVRGWRASGCGAPRSGADR